MVESKTSCKSSVILTLINLSLSSIGAQIGKRDHSTVIHAYKTIEKKMENDVELKQTISKIEQKIKR